MSAPITRIQLHAGKPTTTSTPLDAVLMKPAAHVPDATAGTEATTINAVISALVDAGLMAGE